MEKLPPDHYRVRVDRGPLPPRAILEGQFSEISEIFDGTCFWRRHSARTGENDVATDEVVMLVKHFTPQEVLAMGGLENENIIAWGLKNGLVPADEKETYAFGIGPDTCDLQRQFSLAGLGSSALAGVVQCFAMLSSYSGERMLDGYWLGDKWHADHRFLFVRK